MESSLLAALGHSFYYEDGKGDYAAARQLATTWTEQAPGFECWCWLAAVCLLQGEPAAAEQALARAEKYLPTEAGFRQVLERFRLLCRYECYERTPDEKNAFSPAVAAQKQLTGGVPAVSVTPLAGTIEIPGLENLLAFLDNRLLIWEWRSIRSLLQGRRFMKEVANIADLWQSQMTKCSDLFQKGDVFAALCAGDFCRSANAAQDAGEWLQQAYELAEKQNDTAGEALCWLRFGDWLGAPSSSPTAWNFVLESSSSQSSALPSTTEQQEFSPPSKENLATAEDAWHKALMLFRQIRHGRGEAQAVLRLGYLAFLHDDFLNSEHYTRQAQTLFLSNGDLLATRLAETHLLMVLLWQGKTSEAQELAHSIGEWGARSGSCSWTVGLGLLLGRFARHLILRRGMAELALKAYHTARLLQLAAGAAYHAAQHLTDIGEVYKATSKTEAAVVYFEQAADEIEAILSGEWKNLQDVLNITVHTHTDIAMLLSDNFLLGMKKMDADLMDRSVRRMRAVCEKIYRETHPQVLASMPQTGQVLALCESMSEQAKVLSPLYRAKLQRETGDLPGFEKYWKQAHDALEEVSPDMKYMLGSAVWAMKREWQKAAEAFRNYIGLGGPNAGFMGEMMKTMEQFGEQGKAEIRLQQYRFHTQAHAGFVRTKQFAEALSHYQTLCDAFGKDWWKQEDSPWLTLSDCGEMMEGLGRYNEALGFFDQALEQLEIRRRQLSRDELKVALSGSTNTHYIYTYAARTAMTAKQPERAFNYAEQGKARALLDLMAENRFLSTKLPGQQSLLFKLRETDARLSLFQGMLAKERSRHQPDPARIQQLTAQINDEEATLHALEQGIKNQNTSYEQYKMPETTVLDATAISNELDEDTLLVEYLLAGDNLLLWALTSKGIAHAEAFIAEEWEIRSEVSRLRQAITGRRPWQKQAEQLSNRLLKPLQELIRHFSKIIFVPHGTLHALPFQVLLFGSSPLGLVRSISYLPSASALAFLPKTTNLPKAKVLAVGNPTGDLAAAACEAAFVAKQFGAENNALLGQAATETAVRLQLPEAELLHFATHGNLSEVAPLQSSLSLANGEEITLYELMGMQLKAELVVLSACDTARGSHTGGDDVLGLTRGLIASGAKAAVVSLWQVDDASTGLFMGHFYQQLRRGNPPGTALRQAQAYLHGLDKKKVVPELKKMEVSLENTEVLSFVAKERSQRGALAFKNPTKQTGYEHPYYWGAFILVGRNT